MTILDFWASWCSPCKSFAPVLEKVAKERGIELVKINVEDDNENLSLRHGVDPQELLKDVRSVPTILVIDDEGNTIGRFVGTKSESDLNDFLDKISE